MGWESVEEMNPLAAEEELVAILEKEGEYLATAHQAGSQAALEEGQTRAMEGSMEGQTRSMEGAMQGQTRSMEGMQGSLEVALEETPGLIELRRSVCQWSYESADYFLFDRDLVSISMSYFDRYLALHSAEMANPVLCHLLALTSFYLASKLHGEIEGNSSHGRRVKLRLQDFALMSRGKYCAPMIEEMEMSLLCALRWRVNPPTAMDTLLRLVKLLSLLTPQDVDGWSVFEVARYQTELAVYSHHLAAHKPSKVAFAAVLNAMDSRIVGSKRTVISPPTRALFLSKIAAFGFVEHPTEITRIRSTLKQLCSKSIVLPGSEAKPAAEAEYELPEIVFVDLPQLHCDNLGSPVSVATKHFP